jgi:ABC-type nitrate/sulfonate/bicarbonate transport system ATPase subunit
MNSEKSISAPGPTGDASEATIALEGVSKRFSTPRDVHVLDDVSLSIRDKGFACLLGPSGCGKSTLLNMVAGFDQPSSGRVLFQGRPIERPAPERAVVFQEMALFPWLTTLDNITFGPITQGMDKREARDRASRYIDLVGLNGFERHYPAELSGGMKQRVEIARVLVMEPEALLMDEPFGALDAQTRTLMQELLLEVWDTYHQSVMFITHDVEEAIFLADTIFVMTSRPGRIKQVVPVPLERPRTLEMLTASAFIKCKRTVLDLIREETLKAFAEERKS